MNVSGEKFDEAFDKAKPLTDSQRPLYGYFWTDDSKYILYVKDKDGDENINIFAVDPMASANAETGVPESRNLTPFEGSYRTDLRCKSFESGYYDDLSQ
ncbi:MAG: hypothetical protein IPN49_15505 [Saprospiraceae bacterium]|nr:hypothetical protein [Saprospiraceae bacterium]